MASTVTKYKIFLSSPSDLHIERKKVEEVINELNLSFASQNNIILELVKWETHSAPGISDTGPQEVINSDITEDYDIYIGLLWLKFGTPTKQAGSGTEEEFNSTLDLYKKKPNDIQLLFYFKDTPPNSLKDVKPDVLLKINSFKSNLSDQGVFYWEFTGIEEFAGYLRLHIPKRILQLRESSSNGIGKDQIKESDVDSIDEGFFDLIETSQVSFSESTASLDNITSATELVGDKFNRKTEELTNLTVSQNNASLMKIRRVLSSTAEIMDEYTFKLRIETPAFYEKYVTATDSILKIIMISDSFYEDKEEYISELESTSEVFKEMNINILDSIRSTSSFHKTVDNFPSIQKDVNKARREMSKELEDLVNKLNSCLDLSNEIIKEVELKIGRIRN